MADIQSVLREWIEEYVTLWNNGDSAGCQNFFVEDCKALAPNAKIVEGNKDMKQMIEELFASGWVRVECTPLEQQAMGPDFAFSCSRWVYYNANDEVVAAIKDMNIWKRVGGTWKVYRTIFN